MRYNATDHPYEHLLERVLTHGESRPDRTGTGTLGLFGHHMTFDLQAGFPLVTTKHVSFDVTAKELLWFLSGDTNARTLQEQGVSIWNEWADDDGELGPVYGAQWRSWPTSGTDGIVGGIDQINDVIDGLLLDPYGRRHIVSAWNVSDLDRMALPPCHVLFQFHVSNRGLSCQLYQRSADVFLGVPYNIASYALLTHMIAAIVRIPVDRFIWTGGDVHLYSNHVDAAREQLTRDPFPLPRLELAERPSIDDYRRSDMRVVGYEHHPRIAAPIAV